MILSRGVPDSQGGLDPNTARVMATLDLFLEFMVQRMEKIKGWMIKVLCC